MKRDKILEILAIKARKTSGLEPIFEFRLKRISEFLTGLSSNDREALRYIPIGLISCLEGATKDAISRLIDFGPPYMDNATDLENIKIDIWTLRNVVYKMITAGEFISHLISINNLADINKHMSVIIGRDFFNELRNFKNQTSEHQVKSNDQPIIGNADEVFSIVEEAFKVRHIFAHEIANDFEIDIDKAKRYVDNISIFLSIMEKYVLSLLFPGSAMTTWDMIFESHRELIQSSNELENVIEKLNHFIDDPETLYKMHIAQQAWYKFRNLDADFYADAMFKGGTYRPVSYAHHVETAINNRKTELQSLINWFNEH